MTSQLITRRTNGHSITRAVEGIWFLKAMTYLSPS